MNSIAYLLCEIKSRDLDSRLLIASHLLGKGVAVVVGQRWGIGENRLISPKGCYLFPTANHIQGGGMAQVREAGHIVLASDEEAFAAVADSAHTKESLARTVDAFTTASENSLNSCHKFLACSRTHVEVLRQQFPKHKSKISATGSARVELLMGMRNKLTSEAPYVLVNTGFPLVNSIWDDDTAIQSAIGSLGETATRARVKGQKAGFEFCKSIVRWLVKNHRVVIRPHPAERAEIWRELFPEAEVVENSAPLPWIKGARVLIHGNSTTGLEAALMNVPTLNLNPDPSYGELYTISRVNRTVSTVEQAISTLEEFFRTGAGLDPKISPSALFPPNGAINTAKEIAEMISGALPLGEEFNWGRVARTDLQRQKFTVSLDEIMSNSIIKNARKHGILQLDDSVFLLNPI